MMRYAFYFDATRCVACKTCQVACKVKNGLPAGITFRRVDSFGVGEYPNAKMYHVSHACNHCENPACVATCPTGAMYKADDGTVQHNDDVCIGCKSCVIACPYGAPVLIPDLGIVRKCDACAGTREEDGAPTCVASCGTRALDFGSYDELVAKYPNAVSALACMADPSITTPNVLMDARGCAFNPDFEELTL